jgi:hypothetical protein
MEHTDDEKGIAQVLLTRLVDQRLPRLLEMKERVDGGELLGEFDIDFLEGALRDAQHNERFAGQFPEYTKIVAQVANLYEHITSKALENQQHAKK